MPSSPITDRSRA